MKNKLTGMTLAGLVVAGLLSSMGITAATQATPNAAPSNFANEAFKTVWTRTDALVADGSVKRSYYWGPAPGFSAFEDYAEGPSGKHLVQYFDKSRMELNNPNGDKNNHFYVTNGLLTEELINGRMQVGQSKFVARYPAEIDIASDTDDASATTPTYASFRSVVNDLRVLNRTGELLVDTINRVGFTGQDARYAGYNIRYSNYELATKHNIPDVFWQFLNQTGPVLVDGKQVNARLSDPYFYVTGYPVAEAYWASVKIAGVSNTDVLIQPYERRVLTYVPSAPAGFKVQMGNIGQHYYDWRYNNAGIPTPIAPNFTPAPTGAPGTPAPQKCSITPIRGFGNVWTNNPALRTSLGCPITLEQPMTVIYQPFEHGYMVERAEVFAHYVGYTTVKTIYVLFSDGTAQGFPVNHPEGLPEQNLTPPQGLYPPRHDFGRIWANGVVTGGRHVSDLLGWATAPETVADANLPLPPLPPAAIPTVTVLPTTTPTPVSPGQPTPIPGGAYQAFEHGIMLYTGPATRKILVFFSNSYGDNGVYGGQVFDDTFSGP